VKTSIEGSNPTHSVPELALLALRSASVRSSLGSGAPVNWGVPITS
jgi:hypothetical protein